MTTYLTSCINHNLIGSSHQAPAVNHWAHDLNDSSEQPGGRVHEAHNHMDMHPSLPQVRNATPTSSQPAADQQPLSDSPSASHQSIQLQTESQVPTAVTSSAGTRFQRNSSGYPIDSDPEASVV